MASEVINAVLSAEKAAADSYAESVQKCDLLKAEAHEKARSIQKEMKDEALAKAKENKARAEAEAKATRERERRAREKAKAEGKEPVKEPVQEERVADTKGGYAMTRAEKKLSDE